jgi:hypothetical protein
VAFVNPIGKGLKSARVDMGVDYEGTGSLYAMGPGVITSVYNAGWPGGTFLGLHLDSGQYMYYAEDIQPHVSVGQRVQAGQLVGTATGGGSGIEVGWAAPPGTGQTMAASAGQAAKGSDPGEFPTAYGVSMSNLIKSLGGPPGIISGPITGGIPASQANLYGSGAASGGSSLGNLGCTPMIYWIGVYAVMPLTRSGRKMKSAMKKEYGKKRGERIFYATENKRKGRGIRRRKRA